MSSIQKFGIEPKQPCDIDWVNKVDSGELFAVVRNALKTGKSLSYRCV